METSTFTIQSISKEAIPEHNCVATEVLNTAADIQTRKDSLYRAMILGNAYQRKVKIVFDTLEGTKQVETTIWAATEKNVVLKGGITIPIQSIRQVKVY